MNNVKKNCYIFLLMFCFFYGLVFAHNEDANGYPHSYDVNYYSNLNHDNGNNGGGDNGSGGDSSGGEDSGGKDSGVNGEEGYNGQGMGNTEGFEIMNEANSLDGMVDGEAAGLEGIVAGENSNASELALALEVDSNAGVEAAAAKAQNEVNANKEQSEGEKNSANSGEAGDPVKITKGTYELAEEDIVIGNDNKFAIKRRYESDCKITGSFGYGWKTNLDERIILGTNPKSHKDFIVLNDYITRTGCLISQLEENLKIQYCVESIYTALDEIDERINNCELHITKLEDYIIKLEALKNRASSYSGLVQQIESIIIKASEIKESAEIKKELFENQKISIVQDLQVIKLLRQKLEEAEKENEKKKIFVEKDYLRNERNRKVLFNGMGNYYEETGQDTITVIDDSGYPHILKECQGLWKNDKDYHYKYCKTSGKKLLLNESNGIVKEFDEYGFLIKKTDRNGNYIQLLRDNEERILYIITSDNEKYDFEYKNGFITKITNSRCKEEYLLYSYKGHNLSSVQDADGDTVVMEYDYENHLTKLKKCDGSFISFEYGQQTGKGSFLTTITTNEEGFSEHFEYMFSEQKTVYTDHDGNQTCYWYDSNHRTKKEYRADGSSIEYEYDVKGNLICTNTNGNIVRYNYDSRGNRIAAYYSDGSAEGWKYDENNLLTEYVDRDGLKEEYIRNSTGNIEVYRKGGETVYEQAFDERGRLIQKTVYGQKAVDTKFSYDVFGNLISEICGGLSKEYVYDNRNRIQKSIYNKVLVDEYFYEKHLIRKVNNSGLEVCCLTNGRKDIVKIIQNDLETGECHAVRVEYDKRHLPHRVYSGDNETEDLMYSFLYSPEGKLLAEIMHGAESWIKTYRYKNGLLSEYIQFKTKLKLNNSSEKITEKALDELRKKAGEDVFIEKYQYKKLNGNRESFTITNGLGVTKYFDYDAYGNLIKQSINNDSSIEINYSPAGRINAKQNLYGGWYEYQYDRKGFLSQIIERNAGNNMAASETEYYPDGSIKSITDSYGKVTRYNYDEMGRVSDIQGVNKKVWYQYDSFNRIIKIIIGNTPEKSNSVYCAEYEYSADGKTVTVCEGGKYRRKYLLDAFGNITKQIYGNENERTYRYNSRNQLTECCDAYGNKTLYEYNALGKESKRILPEGNEISFQYNSFGKIEKISDSEGSIYSAVYDKAGQLIQERSRADCEKKYEYDESGRIKRILNGDEIIESYEYTNNGRNVSVTDGNGDKYFYKIDEFGRLVNELNRMGDEQNYLYDEAGQLKSKNNFNDYTTSINYSDDKTEKTFFYSDGSRSVFVYDAIGNIIEAQNSYGKNLYKYDKAGKLIYQKDVTTGEEIFYEYDDAGNRIRVLSTNKDSVYVYGKNNEVKEIFDNKQRVRVKLSYNKNGQEILRKFGNGTEEETLYDRSGRVIVKTLKSERGNLLWGEGYVYNSDGKRSATIDNSGHVTFYEYNNSGRLSAVYYPYTDEHIAKLKSEAVENGLPDNKDIGENRFLTSSEKAFLVPLLNSMQYGLAFNLNSLQPCIKEVYSYDKNGNRISKTTAYGSIEYNYNKENCLISSGSRGKTFINYSYDKMGNLLMEKSKSKAIRYAYNAQNRLIYCEVSDLETGNHAQTSYAYDAFDRRLIVQDRGAPALRTVYDGFSFDVIKQGPTYSNGLFTDSNDTSIRWEKNGRPTGDRYRYLEDETYEDGNRYFYMEEGSIKNSVSRYSGERIMFNVNGAIAAQTTADYGADYFSTDLLGSVRTATDDYSSVKQTYSYDAFGSLLQGSLAGPTDYGYVSKQKDPATQLYNYGYRDYNPKTSRFITQDPIRDGMNWYAYCDGDPINFIDLWGLEVSYTINRDPRSYVVSTDRDTPINTYLDVGILYNSNTNETVIFEHVQSVANYPSTDPNGNNVTSVYNDTIKAGATFDLKIGTTTNIAGGKAAIITNAITIDGRKVNANGYTENGLSEGRALQHSNTNPTTNKDYNTPYSKQCIILPGADNERFFAVLEDWGIQDGQSIKTIIIDSNNSCGK